MAILKTRNEKGEFVDIPSIVGEKGDKGDTGQDGKTPVRGTDFWTEEDIAAMKLHCNDYIDSQLGTINEQLASLTEKEIENEE